MNLVDGVIGPAGVTVGSTVVEIPRELKDAAGTGRVTVGVRPESVTLLDGGAGGVLATVNIVEELARRLYVYASLEHTAAGRNGANIPDVVVRVDPKSAPPSGSRISLRIRGDSVVLFDGNSGLRIVPE